jgi:peptidylprolyl isomerase domain and WD repeat-containing protein 1
MAAPPPASSSSSSSAAPAAAAATAPAKRPRPADAPSSSSSSKKKKKNKHEKMQQKKQKNNHEKMQQKKQKKQKKRPRKAGVGASAAPPDAIALSRLPCTDMYERSYMHRARVTHVVCSDATHFVCTASDDGVVKFWKKTPAGGLEFVKAYTAHVGAVADLALSRDGQQLCSAGAEDGMLKFYDVRNFDMTNMVDLGFTPSCCCWATRPGAVDPRVAVADLGSGAVHVWSTSGSSTSGADTLARSRTVHAGIHGSAHPVTCMAMHPASGAIVSADARGIVEYWLPTQGGAFPQSACKFTSKFTTDLFDLARKKIRPRSVAMAPNGNYFALSCADGKVRLYHFRTGKLRRVFDEVTEEDAAQAQAQADEDGASAAAQRRQAMEADLAHADGDFGNANALPRPCSCNVVFDETSKFLLFATARGVKVVDLASRKVVSLLGEFEDTERFVQLALYQGTPKVSSQRMAKQSVGKTIDRSEPTCDPTLFATSFGKAGRHRFFMFSRREPEEEGQRDVYNEKPVMAGGDGKGGVARSGGGGGGGGGGASGSGTGLGGGGLAQSITLHTSMGDLSLKLFPEHCPKTVENFQTHCKNGYYDGLTFHRIIKSFMIQGGCPLGDGTGGHSIWGGTFEDEFHPSLTHDRAGTLSMANAGPATNGSQFFLTANATPWLDNKHTVFGRVVAGMDVLRQMEQVPTGKHDRPLKVIRIVSTTVLG